MGMKTRTHDHARNRYLHITTKPTAVPILNAIIIVTKHHPCLSFLQNLSFLWGHPTSSHRLPQYGGIVFVQRPMQCMGNQLSVTASRGDGLSILKLDPYSHFRYSDIHSMHTNGTACIQICCTVMQLYVQLWIQRSNVKVCLIWIGKIDTAFELNFVIYATITCAMEVNSVQWKVNWDGKICKHFDTWDWHFEMQY